VVSQTLSQYETAQLGHHNFANPQVVPKLPGESIYAGNDQLDTTQDQGRSPPSPHVPQFTAISDPSRAQGHPQQAPAHQTYQQPQFQGHQQHQGAVHGHDLEYNTSNMVSPRISNTSITDHMVTSHAFVVPGVPLPVPDMDSGTNTSTKE
jgi:hypothetical protein